MRGVAPTFLTSSSLSYPVQPCRCPNRFTVGCDLPTQVISAQSAKGTAARSMLFPSSDTCESGAIWQPKQGQFAPQSTHPAHPATKGTARSCSLQPRASWTKRLPAHTNAPSAAPGRGSTNPHHHAHYMLPEKPCLVTVHP